MEYFREEKRLVVYLKPAEFAKNESTWSKEFLAFH